MADSPDKLSLCGLWVDPEGVVHLAEAAAHEPRRTRQADFRPFLWSRGGAGDELAGAGAFDRLQRFDSLETYQEAVKELSGADCVTVKPLEHQYLLETRERIFGGLHFGQLRRCQLDIETACSVPDGFPSPRRKEDRVLAIGLRMDGENRFLLLEEMTDAAERVLLKSLNEALEQMDPDVIEGHNIFKFDLDYLRQRFRRFKVPCRWGRFGQEASWRNSRIRIAERWVDFPRCDLPGRTVFDTYLMIQVYDVTTRDLASYSLKEVAVHLGISDRATRTYLKAEAIQKAFTADRETFLGYLGDDLRETAGIADLLLPTYVAQIKSFPMTLQEACLRGTGGKVDLLFLEKYYHAGQALPEPPSVSAFEGAYSRSFVSGVHRHVLHYDVASLYPSLLLHIGRNPAGDTLGIFIPMLQELRTERLRYKALAREAASEELRREYQARQASFKILINSFYGYLGFGGARFADSELAAEVTRRGRELLVKLIEAFELEGCTVLEADTDGIYVSSEKDFDNPEGLLARVAGDLPLGIDLEFDGSYPAMLCYKAKNYALYDGEQLRIRGSALRSRGIEPYLKALTDQLIRYLLGMDATPPGELIAAYRKTITSGEMPVAELARREYLSMNPEAYSKSVETSKKPRRASLEVALKMEPQPRMGEQVAYFLTYGDKKRAPDWQIARPLADYDPETCPYNADAYLKKLDDWEKRYEEFLPGGAEQTELL
ncbi:DNA polymerase [Ruficoccus amylovorans]|uniref:DNA-directed DNA polymerase n=1 Tax=Ruficoccus amylovorans TaxID=1804625 RepID=A0A842HFT1_9BACT|nr:DNA polymerase domain-containing protein [Ruficoccus amylovorans]MBC2595383.1 DNA polymerase [Ruficoccus amylovorans]